CGADGRAEPPPAPTSIPITPTVATVTTVRTPAFTCLDPLVQNGTARRRGQPARCKLYVAPLTKWRHSWHISPKRRRVCHRLRHGRVWPRSRGRIRVRGGAVGASWGSEAGSA